MATDPLWIAETDVRDAVDLLDAVDAVEQALLLEAKGEGRTMEKTHVAWDGHTLHALGAALTRLATERPGLATVTTTHHLEDLPPVTTHAAVLSRGRVVGCGPVADVLTSELLSAAYGAPLRAWHDAAGWHLELEPGSGGT